MVEKCSEGRLHSRYSVDRVESSPEKRWSLNSIMKWTCMYSTEPRGC